MQTRLTAAIAAAALVITAAGAFGATPEPRRATLPYAPTDDNFTAGGPNQYLIVGTGDTEAQYDFELAKGERSVEVFIQDDSELPVGGVVMQWKPVGRREAGPASATTYDAVTWHRFCGMTEAPVPLKPKFEVRIMLYEGTCLDGTPSTPTTGQIVADFHRR